MKILGIDPGTAITGFGVIKKLDNRRDQFAILQFGVITTQKTDSDAKRLQVIYEDLVSVVKKFKPDRVGIEKLFFTKNQTTAMAVSQARGIVLLVCAQYQIPIFEFTPLQVKNILTGYGKADKKQVQFMVQQAFSLKQLPKPDDAADALGIALCAAHAK